MPNFHLTPDAESDLIEIRNFTTKQWGGQQSQKYLSDLRKTILLLAEAPSLGKARPDVGTDIFSFPYVSHVIYYVVQKLKLIVFAVFHKHMVPVNHLVEREII